MTNETTTQPARRHMRRIIFWIAMVLTVVAVAACITFEILAHRAEPILKARVIDTLSARFNSQVTLDSFHVSVFRGFQISGKGLKLYPNTLHTQEPLFAVNQFSFRTNWHNLLRVPMHVGNVYVEGLAIHLPPKEERKNIPRLQSNEDQPKIKIFVDELLIDNATLILGTSKPGKIPLDFEIHNLKMRSIGAGRPMEFHAILVNPKPVGDINSSGNFGPFDADSPGDTPVSGKYNFSNADLGTLKGIGGILFSTGEYQGTLNNIVVDGETDTPDFRITIANHPVPLHTKFHAIVDGTNGDTYLQPVDAMLLHSHIVARGDVVRVPNQQGHNITLDVTVDPARIQDLLQLGVKTQPPIMTGKVRLQTKLNLPPGEKSVTDKLRLQGKFEVQNAHFTSDKIQSKVDQLSLRSQGKPEEAKENGKEGVAADVASYMRGNFVMGNSKLTITGLKYNVPGADIALDGVYSLDGNQFDFHGKARLDAKISQMVTGWKSILLKPVDPFFSKHGAGTEVPIQITGTKSEPHFGLDFGHKDKK